MYVGSVGPCDRAIALARSLGLFPERIDASPWVLDEPVEPRPADDTFWAEVADRVARRGAVILEEGHVFNAARWHRLRSGDLGEVRARLTSRARVFIWPDLSPDVDAVLRALAADDGSAVLVWEHRDGRIAGFGYDGDYPRGPDGRA